MKFQIVLLLAAISLAGCGRAFYSDSGHFDGTISPASDNSAVNRRDAQSEAITPLDQSERKADIRTTADIRKGLLRVSGMSLYARNCKVITAHGKVTLRGPVKSQAEKDTVAEIAARIAGADRVDNQLQVKGS